MYVVKINIVLSIYISQSNFARYRYDQLMNIGGKYIFP